MMPFLRTPPANDSDDTESITTSIEDREAKEYRAWAADQEFMENCIQVDGVILDARSELSLEEQYTNARARQRAYGRTLLVVDWHGALWTETRVP